MFVSAFEQMTRELLNYKKTGSYDDLTKQERRELKKADFLKEKDGKNNKLADVHANSKQSPGKSALKKMKQVKFINKK